MTPYNHHLDDTYVTTYRNEIAEGLRLARTTGGRGRTLQGTIARAVVRLGAWMLPEKPELVDGHILVLDVQPQPSADLERAA